MRVVPVCIRLGLLLTLATVAAAQSGAAPASAPEPTLGPRLDRVAILAARDRPEVPRERLLNGRIPGGSAAIVHGAQRSGPRAPT